MGFPPVPDPAAPAPEPTPGEPAATPPPPVYTAPPVATPPPTQAPGGYPVRLTVIDDRNLHRLWGVPYFGILVRSILAIPHLIVLMILGLGMYVVMALGWIPILILGRVPGIQAAWIKEYIHRSTRILAYTYFLFPGGYPPFGPGSPNPVDLTFDLEGRTISRFWGIPLIGIIVRYIVLIPHFIVLYILFLVGILFELILWIPILLLGRYPGWAVSLYGGILRYSARVEAYLLLLPVPYPPLFSFS
jgi:hypothetical protein